MSLGKKRSSTGHVLLPASDTSARDAAKPLLLHKDVGSWTFGRGTVVWTIWPAVLLHTAFAAAVTSVSLTTQFYLAVPPVLITVLGVVIGFVIAYRASSGYDRYWTGRCCWGDIIKTSRTMSRLVWIHVPIRIDKGSPSPDLELAERCMNEKRLALDMVEGFAVAVKHHLRGEVGIYYEDLYHLVRPLHKHTHSQKIRQHHVRHEQDGINGRSSSVSPSSLIASPQYESTWSPDPIIPAINEYGTFGRSSSSVCSSVDEFERPFLFPSAPKQPTRSKILTELVPFSSFFSSLTSNLRRRRREKSAESGGGGSIRQDEDGEDDAKERLERKRRYTGPSGRKFRPKVAGGGMNVPLEILQCLSEWLATLDERGVVSGNPLGGMYGCISAFEDSLTALERILTTPLPFVYSAHIRQCVWLYLFLLPFQLVQQFGWYTIPGVGIAAFFYIGFLAAGEEIEQPFGYDENDLDLDLFCREIIHADIKTLKKAHNSNVLPLRSGVEFGPVGLHQPDTLMPNPYKSKEPNKIKVTLGPTPTIELLDSDCDGRIYETVLSGKRILTRAPEDHKRYWHEMVGTFLRNELGLCPELPRPTVFWFKFPKNYELYGSMRPDGAWDYYLLGFYKDNSIEKFDSPANFVMHAKWLAYGRPPNCCECKPCSETPQREISARLTLGGAKISIPRDDVTSTRTQAVRASK
ncbi:hypothetical protein ACEPAF_27 [Sanghuangporus sanghuang]